jgi:hypothetical protein
MCVYQDGERLSVFPNYSSACPTLLRSFSFKVGSEPTQLAPGHVFLQSMQHQYNDCSRWPASVMAGLTWSSINETKACNALTCSG